LLLLLVISGSLIGFGWAVLECGIDVAGDDGGDDFFVLDFFAVVFEEPTWVRGSAARAAARVILELLRLPWCKRCVAQLPQQTNLT
jgi:hypothetical protein